MNIPLTFGILVAITASLVVLRAFWLRVPDRLRRFLVVSAFVIPALFAISLATRWVTSSTRLNYGFYWLCIASYEFLLILFTRARPRWLTSIIVTVLILPILSDSIFIPLALLFGPAPTSTARIANGLVSELVPWGTGTPETSGTDLFIYYQPQWTHLIRRRLMSPRFFGGQCNAWAAYAAVQPDQRTVEVICPPWPNLPNSGETNFLPLYRPLFFEFAYKGVSPSK